jgi:hypothetical protein
VPKLVYTAKTGAGTFFPLFHRQSGRKLTEFEPLIERDIRLQETQL